MKVDQPEGKAPLLSVFGGKITTSRKLAEHALEKLAAFFPNATAPWNRDAHLPGGDIAVADVAQYIEAKKKAYSFLKPANVVRLFKAYGTEMDKILNGARFASDLGQFFGPVSEREIEHLRANEWVTSADDILWRRSKLGLHMSAEEQTALRAYMGEGIIKKTKKRLSPN